MQLKTKQPKRMAANIKLIFSILLLCAPAKAGAMEEGLKKAAEAFIIQYEVDKNFDKLIRKHVPEKYLEFATRWSMIGKIITEQRIEYTWKF